MSTIMKQFLSWIKKPDLWFSLVAIVISSYTFISVHFWPGSISIYLADDVALQCCQDKDLFISMVIPIVLHNSGQPNKWKIINDIKAKVKMNSKDPVEYNWIQTSRFISQLEYEKLDSKAEAKANVKDHFLYESRKVPFGVAGEQAVFKLCNFEPPQKISSFSGSLTVEIVLEVVTMGG